VSPHAIARVFAGALFGLVSLSAASAHAQEVEEIVRETVVYQKKTVVSFEDDTIDGDLTRPDGEYIDSRKRIRHSNLIKIRDNFRTRVLRSISRL
jgi:hypothetical protein